MKRNFNVKDKEKEMSMYEDIINYLEFSLDYSDILKNKKLSDSIEIIIDDIQEKLQE